MRPLILSLPVSVLSSAGEADVRLFASDGRFVRAHRALLAALSPSIDRILREEDPYQCRYAGRRGISL